jgi:hypothetical protein
MAAVLTLAACAGSTVGSSTAAPSSTAASSATAAPSATAVPSIAATPVPSAACAVTVEPEVAAPGGWSVVVGRGFKLGERIEWTQAAEDGTLEGSWDTDGFEPMQPDFRGGFGFGLGSAGPEAIGHTINATIRSASCTTTVSWRIEADNAQTRPLPAPSPGPCTAARTAVDRVDDSPDHQVHLIYAIPSDGYDEELDANGRIRASFEHIETYLRDRLGGRAFRIDTCDGMLDISFLRLDRTAAEYAAMRDSFTDGLALDLIRYGFRRGQKLYIVVWGGLAQWARLEVGCGGEAGYHGVAVAFLRGVDGEVCRPIGEELPIGEPDTGLAHEVLHVLGLPAACGANVDDSGHVADDPADLMYGIGHTTADVIDAGHDDYYLHAIADCPDLADSAFLDPLPGSPQLPPGWPTD